MSEPGQRMSRTRRAQIATSLLCNGGLRGTVAALGVFCAACAVGVMGADHVDVIAAQLSRSEVIRQLSGNAGGMTPDAMKRDLELFANYVRAMSPAAQQLTVPPYRQVEIFTMITDSAAPLGVGIESFRYFPESRELEITCLGSGEDLAARLSQSALFDGVVCKSSGDGKHFTIICNVAGA